MIAFRRRAVLAELLKGRMAWLLKLVAKTGNMRRALCLTPFLALATAARRLVSRTSRNERVYHFVGKSWVVTVSALFWLSVGSAYDGSGPQLAESLATQLGLLAVSCAGALLGAQGALFNLSTETRLQVAVTVFASTLLKLHQCQSPAYRLVQLCVVLPFALGFAWTPRSAARAATSQAANVVMRAADAVCEPFLVTGTDMHILAVNSHFTELLGYAVDEVLGQPMTMLIADAPDIHDHDQWLAHFTKGCGSTPQSKRGHVRSVLTKKGEWLPMRIVMGKTRCALNGTRFFTAELCSLALEHRNAQLVAEKERLEWEVASHHGDANDPRKALGDSHPIEAGSPLHKQPAHRTLGALQDQGITDDAVSRARSYDHEDSFNPLNTTRPTTTRSRDDWPIARCVLDAPPSSAGFTDTSLQSSEMDTVSVAAAKDVTRAPRPPKAGRFSSGPPSQHSEPAPERKRASQEPPPRGAKGASCEHSRVLPQVERNPMERA